MFLKLNAVSDSRDKYSAMFTITRKKVPPMSTESGVNCVATTLFALTAPIEHLIFALMRQVGRSAALPAARFDGGASGQWRRFIAGSLLVTAGPRTVAVVES